MPGLKALQRAALRTASALFSSSLGSTLSESAAATATGHPQTDQQQAVTCDLNKTQRGGTTGCNTGVSQAVGLI